ncbi:hypothetical protein ABIA35_002335 [Catenulispora sp. MAP12-49]|uniref:hypothetical protein n=1 Tax=unclassified Catenulispora TaxID=414885 RepID=UPI0035158AAB
MTIPARTYRPLAAAGAAALALCASVGVTQAATSPQHAKPVTHGIAYLNTQVNLPNGVWTDTPVEVNLPHAGTYDLDANVRGRLAGNPAVNAYITARLWNVTANAELPQSERLVYQIIDLNAGTAQAGGNNTAPIDELVTVDKPTTIRLQARRVDAAGAASIAQIYSDGQGYTSLRFDHAVG